MSIQDFLPYVLLLGCALGIWYVWKKGFGLPSLNLGTRTWSAVRHVSGSFSSKLGLGALLLVAAGLVLLTLHLFNVVPSDWGIPLWVFPLVLVGAGIMIYFADPKEIRTAIIMLAVIATFIAVLEFYKHGELRVGYRWVVGYAVVIPLGFMVAKFLETGLKRTVAGFLLIGCFVMLGFSSFLTWDEFLSYRLFNDNVQRASAPTHLPSGVPRYEAILTSYVQADLNPGALCKIDWHEVVPGQCVYAYDPAGNLLGHDCNGFINLTGRSPAKFSAATKGTPVKVTYTLSQCRR